MNGDGPGRQKAGDSRLIPRLSQAPRTVSGDSSNFELLASPAVP